MLKLIVKRLISVKSIVTLALTGVFSYLAIVGKIDGKEFLTIFTVIISFYFGTQSQKTEDSIVEPTIAEKELEKEDEPHGKLEEREGPPS